MMEKQTSRKIKVLQINNVGSTRINFYDLAKTLVGTYFDEDVREDQIHLEL